MKDLTLRYIATCLQEASLLKSPLSSQENTWTLHDASRRISHCLIDSRKLHSPQDTLFFALRTASNDGHKFVSELYQRGVRAFVVMENPATWASFDQADFLVVEDTLQALQALSACVRKACQAPLLVIAGSNGKTIVKEWIWQLLRQEVQITRSPGSFNSQIGVPLSLLELDDETQLAIIEAGISRKGEMEKLARIIHPNIGLLTNIGSPHQENFASWQEKMQEKCRLFEACETIIYCADQVEVDAEMKRLFPAERLLAWSSKDFSPALLAAFPFDDEASLQNVGHALAFCRFFMPQLSEEALIEKLARIEPAPMRLELKEGKNACVLINDTYNADVQALALALDFQAGRDAAKHLSRSLILSDIYQSGKDAAQLYGELAEMISHYKISRFVGIGPALCQYADAFPAGSRFFLSTEDFLASDITESFSQELVLIKGSRRFGFERITEALALKTHQTRLEVNLDAIVHNYRYFRSLLKASTKMIAMVKAEAYGLGAVEISRTLQSQGCDAVAVAVVDEGIRLRQAGISIPILVMNPDISVLPLCYEYHLEPEIYSFALLRAFLECGQRLGIRQYPIHLKLDTGMHRLGFTQADIPALLALLQSQKTLMLSSVFTHLAGSDEACFDDYTTLQWQAFDAMSSQIRAAFPYAIDRHILNSAGIERFTQWQCERVRLGIGLYGISPVNQQALMQVASFKTQILQLHHYAKGESIGYSRRAYLERDSVVATIPVGYADGFLRRNKGGEVLVNGHRARLLGNICMDACMVDVTDIPDVKEGDAVVLFGDSLSISQVAERLDTIPYEILTSVSQRVKRVYFHE
ncbi:MAG: alanine racemase [Bacteroidales bacterium]|nr:alanine racemase [Bacteroidales bacterium]